MALAAVLAVVCAGLAYKIWRMRRDARAMAGKIQGWLEEDTNVTIGLSGRDGAMRALADELNRQLRVLREERRRYRRGDRELKEAVTNISHDLRTPLAALCGYLDLLEREETGETARRYLARIREGADTLRKRMEELFRYSFSISEGELKREPVDLVEVLENTLLSFYGTFTEKEIRPALDLPEEAVIRELDGDALSRIFTNLIGNAVEHGSGDLAVALDRSGTVMFSNRAAHLTPVTVGRLFDRYYTVEGDGGSTGLGLAIAKHLTERMGGTIEAALRDGVLSVAVRF